MNPETELLKNITEITAAEVYSLFGKMNKQEADKTAVECMRKALNLLPIRSRVVIGEGEKDEASFLFSGELLGQGDSVPTIDLAVDPLECTTNFARGLPNSMAVIGYAKYGSMQYVPGTYMEQWIAGPLMKENWEPNSPIQKNIEKLCDSMKKKPSELLIAVQDRPRHEAIIRELRNLGVRISLLDSGSITATLDICLGYGPIDALIGTYGAPEGLLSAIIAKSTGSEMKAIIRPHDEKSKTDWLESGGVEGEIMDPERMIHGDFYGFIATGISANLVLKGIRLLPDKYMGSTLLIDNSGVRYSEFERKKIGV